MYQPIYCQIFHPVDFQYKDLIFYPTALSAGGGLVSLPRPSTAPTSRLRNSLRTRPLPPSHPHQRPLKTEISFQTSPHQQGRRANNDPLTLTVTSGWCADLAQTTMIWLGLSHAKKLPQFRAPLWTHQLSSKKSEISSRSSTKGSPISTHQGIF